MEQVAAGGSHNVDLSQHPARTGSPLGVYSYGRIVIDVYVQSL
jgi:hypothetical protein